MNRALEMKQSHRLIVGPTSSGANALTGLGWLAPRYGQHSRTVGIDGRARGTEWQKNRKPARFTGGALHSMVGQMAFERSLLDSCPLPAFAKDVSSGSLVYHNSAFQQLFTQRDGWHSELDETERLVATTLTPSVAAREVGNSSHPLLTYSYAVSHDNRATAVVTLVLPLVSADPVGKAAQTDTDTEVNSMRDTLARTRAAQDAILDSLPQLVALFGTDGTLVQVNRGFRELIDDVQWPSVWQATHHLQLKALEDAKSEGQICVELGKGSVWLQIELTQLSDTVAPQGIQFLLVARDITRQRASDERVQQAQRLESLGRLAGGVAHDFNNILTVILGSADFLEAELGGNDRARHDLEVLVGAAEHARHLTYQLLAFAKEQGSARVVHVEELVSNATQMIYRLLSEDIVVVLRLRAPKAAAWIDATQLEQLLINLAVNARDAMKKGGTLTISTDFLTITSDTHKSAALPLQAGEYVVLGVKDTGDGMSSEVQARAFDPFFTTKGPGQGTGLGLSTVYGIVSSAGGHVSLTSAPGEGTEVKVYLPRYLPEVLRQILPVPKRDLRGDGLRVLLVEDDIAVRAVSLRILDKFGFFVLVADDPTHALDLAKETPIDVVVTDMVMPGMSGLELAERLTESVGPLPTLFVSGHAEDVIRQRGVELSQLTLLHKPFSPEQLVEHVLEVARKGATAERRN